jgi:hypothetical protein
MLKIPLPGVEVNFLLLYFNQEKVSATIGFSKNGLLYNSHQITGKAKGEKSLDNVVT